jgi:hypothetical protein
VPLTHIAVSHKPLALMMKTQVSSASITYNRKDGSESTHIREKLIGVRAGESGSVEAVIKNSVFNY